MSDSRLGATLAALAPLWSVLPSDLVDLNGLPEFAAFKQHCLATYPAADRTIGFSFGLSDALRSAGLPCLMRKPATTSSIEESAQAIHDALVKTVVRTRYLCPLDLADDLPEMRFGNATVRRFSVDEIRGLFNEPRLVRHFPEQFLEADRLAHLQWLVVEETRPVPTRAGQRATPFLYEDMRRDFGAVEPHAAIFPEAVSNALFALLLAPWEKWSSFENDWCGFNLPWVHSVSDDLFARPKPVPSADTLSWQPSVFRTHDGEDIEIEVPIQIPLNSDAEAVLSTYDHGLWAWIETAIQRPLFETPIKHFLVRAAVSGGMDEIMAHMTAIEAALGLESDHPRKGQPKTSGKTMGATARLKQRISVLLSDPRAAEDYGNLFQVRSTYVHGRSIAGPIPSEGRNLARRLARRVVVALIDAANGPDGKRPREEFLASIA